jgi:membrane glycosyltransferase
MAGALQQLRQDAELLEYHLQSLSVSGRRKFRQIDVALATARSKLDECGTFDEAVSWLDTSEVRAVLNNPALLQRALQMPGDASP